MGLPTPANRNGLGAEASHCGSRLARIGSHSWDSGRLIAAAAALTHTGKTNSRLLSVDGHIDTVDPYTWDGHNGAVQLVVANGHADAVG
jgi:hypothetical protein